MFLDGFGEVVQPSQRVAEITCASTFFGILARALPGPRSGVLELPREASR